MEIITIIGYIGALFVGISLGMIGGGGSVLTVPILVYLFGINEQLSTAYSLFIVGLVSAIGAIQYAKQGNIAWRDAFLFGTPALISVTLVRKFLVPMIPDVIFVVNNFALSRRMLILGVFAAFMFPAAIYMIRSKKDEERVLKGEKTFGAYALTIAEGVFVGGLTGLVGAGGGFLIIPAMVSLLGLRMKVAIGTSLFIIAAKSLSGFFLGDVWNLTIDWQFLAIFSGLAIVGIVLGTLLAKKIDGAALKKVFGIFILALAVLIIYLEFI